VRPWARQYYDYQTLKENPIDEFQDVTLLYADIAGFTKYSARVPADQVVKMLSTLCTEFDKLCVKHQVYKVYTIGDCYVVMGFLDKDKRNPREEARNVVQMALGMIKTLNEINIDGLSMRIGIHTVL